MGMIVLPLDRVEENGVLVLVVTVIGLAVAVEFSVGSVQVIVLGLVNAVDVVILSKKRSKMRGWAD